MIKDAYDNNWLNYMCINILKKQYHSSTSPFHKKYRKNQSDNEIGDIPSEPEEFDYELISKIEWVVDNKLDIVDRELFKMYYKMDRYDRWLGDLKDETCKKPQSSYRKMEIKLALKGEPRITISRSTISLSHQRSLMIIKKELKNYGIII
jgi:GTPase involved in cell partitioning and DNA repair